MSWMDILKSDVANWEEVLKWKPPNSWLTFTYKDTSPKKRADDKGYGNVEAGSKESPSVIVRPHYMFRGDERGGSPNETEMPQWIEKLGELSKGSYWFWRFPEKNNLQIVLVEWLDKGDRLPSSEQEHKVDRRTLIFNTIYPKDGRQPPKDNVIPRDIWNAGKGFSERGQNKTTEDKDVTTSLILTPEEVERRKEKVRQKKLKRQKEAFQKHKDEKKKLLQEQVDRKEISRFQANKEKEKLDNITMKEYLIEIGEK